MKLNFLIFMTLISSGLCVDSSAALAKELKVDFVLPRALWPTDTSKDQSSIDIKKLPLDVQEKVFCNAFRQSFINDLQKTLPEADDMSKSEVIFKIFFNFCMKRSPSFCSKDDEMASVNQAFKISFALVVSKLFNSSFEQSLTSIVGNPSYQAQAQEFEELYSQKLTVYIADMFAKYS